MCGVCQVSPRIKRLDVSDGPEVNDWVLEALQNRAMPLWGASKSSGTASLQWLNLSGCSQVGSLGASWYDSGVATSTTTTMTTTSTTTSTTVVAVTTTTPTSRNALYALSY